MHKHRFGEKLRAMTPREFVECFVREKRALVDAYRNGTGTAVAGKIGELQLGPEKRELLSQILDGVLTDAFYTILLGLEGEASIGGRQETYRLCDAQGTVLTGGAIEAEAWKAFHGDDSGIIGGHAG
jgi:hypothetical protein